jgi:hypothetical protein
MSPKHIRKWAFFLVCFSAAVALPIGCNTFIGHDLGHETSWGNDPINPAEYPLSFKDGPKKGKEVVVAISTTFAPGIDFAFAGSERKLTREITKRLSEISGDSGQKLKVINPEESEIDTHEPNWRLMYLNFWGQKRFVDLVIKVHFDKLSLYPPDGLNRVYDGQSQVTVDVEEVDTAGNTKPRYHYVFAFKYPQTGAIDATSTPVTRYKQEFLEHLADEIAKMHVEHKAETGTAVK